MKPFAEKFYKGRKWQACREAYMKKVNWLCERCLKEGIITPATVVHHKIYLNEHNIKDPSVALNFDNLEALCSHHHNEEHLSRNAKRYTVDEFGRVKIRL